MAIKENQRRKAKDKYNHNIEDWWRHCGVADRIQASGIWATTDVQDYLTITDNWWNSRTNTEKVEIYEEFFDEN